MNVCVNLCDHVCFVFVYMCLCLCSAVDAAASAAGVDAAATAATSGITADNDADSLDNTAHHRKNASKEHVFCYYHHSIDPRVYAIIALQACELVLNSSSYCPSLSPSTVQT